jgi:hypothetical protein
LHVVCEFNETAEPTPPSYALGATLESEERHHGKTPFLTAVFDPHMLPLGKTCFEETFAEAGNKRFPGSRIAAAEKSDQGQRSLGARRKRARREGSTKKAHELAPLHLGLGRSIH